MRTTITLDDGLLEALKEEAHRRGSSVSTVIAEAVRMALSSPATPAVERPFQLVTFRGEGALPGIDLDRPSEILERDDLEPGRPGIR